MAFDFLLLTTTDTRQHKVHCKSLRQLYWIFTLYTVQIKVSNSTGIRQNQAMIKNKYINVMVLSKSLRKTIIATGLSPIKYFILLFFISVLEKDWRSPAQKEIWKYWYYYLNFTHKWQNSTINFYLSTKAAL